MDEQARAHVNRAAIMRSRMAAGRVRRYHTWSTHSDETVAHHSWAVMMIYVDLYGVPSGDVTYHVLTHDLSELHTGDLPFPVKARYPALRDEIDRVESDARRMLGVAQVVLTRHERMRVKLCDLLQMAELGAHEVRMGNEYYGRPIMESTLDEARLLAGTMDREELGGANSALVDRWIGENCRV